MAQTFNNYAFIDGNNLHLGTRDAGWIPDYCKLRQHLKIRYNVGEAYYFIGEKDGEEGLYNSLRSDGYTVITRPTYVVNGEVKGNCDVDLTLHCMLEYSNFNKAVIVSGDGDFYSLIKYLKDNRKLRMVILPNKETFAEVIPKACGGQIAYLENIKHEILFDHIG